MQNLFKFFGRLGALFDKSAWLLIAPAFIGLFLIDHTMAITLIEWALFAIVLSGVAIIVSRICFPQIHLDALLAMATDGRNIGAAIVASSLIIFVALLIFSLVFWAKA